MEIAFLSNLERLRVIARYLVGVVYIALLVMVPIGAKEVKVVGSVWFRLTCLSLLLVTELLEMVVNYRVV